MPHIVFYNIETFMKKNLRIMKPIHYTDNKKNMKNQALMKKKLRFMY